MQKSIYCHLKINVTDYVVELRETTNDGLKNIYLNCHPTECKTFGQLLNHSSLHPNAVTKIYTTGEKN